jgi:hypothetical protein
VRTNQTENTIMSYPHNITFHGKEFTLLHSPKLDPDNFYTALAVSDDGIFRIGWDGNQPIDWQEPFCFFKTT